MTYIYIHTHTLYTHNTYAWAIRALSPTRLNPKKSSTLKSPSLPDNAAKLLSSLSVVQKSSVFPLRSLIFIRNNFFFFFFKLIIESRLILRPALECPRWAEWKVHPKTTTLRPSGEYTSGMRRWTCANRCTRIQIDTPRKKKIVNSTMQNNSLSECL